MVLPILAPSILYVLNNKIKKMHAGYHARYLIGGERGGSAAKRGKGGGRVW